MALPTATVTTQGQRLVPAEVRLDGSGGETIARRAGTFNWEDIHRSLFTRAAPARRSVAELKEGIRRNVRKRRGVG